MSMQAIALFSKAEEPQLLMLARWTTALPYLLNAHLSSLHIDEALQVGLAPSACEHYCNGQSLWGTDAHSMISRPQKSSTIRSCEQQADVLSLQKVLSLQNTVRAISLQGFQQRQCTCARSDDCFVAAHRMCCRLLSWHGCCKQSTDPIEQHRCVAASLPIAAHTYDSCR